VDVLVPMMPMDRETFDRELSLGRDAAFREAEAYWKRKPATAATFNVPEDHVNQFVRRVLQSSVVTSERDPQTGTYTMLTGGMGYGVGTWATPVSLTMAASYLPMGRFDVVERYLQGVKDSQGKSVPPGDGFQPHEGYLSLPSNVQVIPWLPDHGSLLWLVSQHVLLSGNKAYMDEWTPVIVKACDWIKYARAIPHHGVQGVMPAAGASDDESTVRLDRRLDLQGPHDCRPGAEGCRASPRGGVRPRGGRVQGSIPEGVPPEARPDGHVEGPGRQDAQAAPDAALEASSTWIPGR